MNDIAARRLQAQRLTGAPFTSPLDAIRWLTAVQAQDYGAAKWALAQRSGATTDVELDRLFDQGAILRTHVLRPTWHFVLPEDIGWLLALTGPRVRAGLVARYRRLELDEKVARRAEALFTAALAGGSHLTRGELGEVLSAARISPDGQRLPHLIMRAELDSLIASGPRRGKQFTYALLEERVPKPRALDRDQAVAELTLRYFRSHGPAQVQDFMWWSGLRMADRSITKPSKARITGSTPLPARLGRRLWSRTCCPTTTNTPWPTATERRFCTPTSRSTPYFSLAPAHPDHHRSRSRASFPTSSPSGAESAAPGAARSRGAAFEWRCSRWTDSSAPRRPLSKKPPAA